MNKLLLQIVLALISTGVFAEQIGVLTTSNQVNLLTNQSGMEGVSTTGQTSVGFAAGSTSGGFDIQLASPVLLDKVQMTVSGTADIHWQAIKGSQVIDLWAKQSNGLMDLSGNNIVADQLRLVVSGSDLGSVTVSGIQVYGEDPSTVAHRIIPTSLKANAATSFFYGPENLFDGNISTDWEVYQPSDSDNWLNDIRGNIHNSWSNWWRDWDGAYDARIDAVLPDGKRVAQVQIYFGPKAAGSVEIQGLVNGKWQSIGTTEAIPSTWGEIVNPNPNELVQEIQIISHDNWTSQYEADLAEVFIWGSGNWTGDTIEDPATNGTDATGNEFGFYSADPTASSTPYFEFSIQSQSGTASPTLEVNGKSFGSISSYMTDGNISYYRVNVSSAIVNQGLNLIWVRGITGQWQYGRLHTMSVDGRALWASSEGTVGDGWKYLPLQTGSGTEYTLPSLQPGGQFQIWGSGALQSGTDKTGWVEPPYITTSEGKIYEGWPTGASLKVVPSPAGIGEVKFSGVSSVSDTPKLQLLWPANGQALTTSDINQHVLTGMVAGKSQTITVNGKAATIKGSLFWVPLSTLGLISNQVNVITVTGTATDGTITSQSIAVAVGIGTLWNPGIGSGSVTTSEESYTITGQTYIPNTQVFVGNQVVVPTNGNFSVEVPLLTGTNVIPVQLVYPSTGAILESLNATILCTAQEISLNVDGEGQTAYVNQAQYSVTGTVVSKNRVQLKINNQSTMVSDNHFQGTVTLKSGQNTITVVAASSNETESKTISVYYDSNIPTLTLTSPVAGSWVNQQILVTGTLTDPEPDSVLVNGVKYAASSGKFSFPIATLQEGQFTYQFQAENKAGTLGSVQTISFGVDNTPPAAFTITSNVIPTSQGWTNVNKPIITYTTTDALSGISHYEYSVNSGAWSTVASPLTLPTISEGIDVVQVRALDKAGNATVESVIFQVDTVAPSAVSNLRAIPGNGQIDVVWTSSDTSIISYQVTRTPAWSDGVHVVTTPEVLDTALSNGTVYTYTVWAVDHAANVGPQTTTSQSIVGLSVSPVSSTGPTIVEFQNVKMVVPQSSLPTGTAAVLVKQIDSQTLKSASSYPIVSPIYSFTTLAADSSGGLQETDHTEMTHETLVVLDYDATQLPNGFPETNLGAYYWDTTWGKWFKIEKSSVDTVNKKIVFTTNHFTDFSIQPTMMTDLSPQQLKDAGHSPFKTESSAGPVTVSPQGGTAMTEVTDFVMPGKNGFSLPIKRIYDSQTALSDSPSLSLSASLTFNSVNDILQAAGIAGQLINEGVSGMQSVIASKIQNLVQGNGDYSLGAGVGWRLNFPYVVTSNTSVFVRLPNGGYYNINQMHSNNDFWTSNPVSRTLDFDFHEGEDFHFRVTQVRSNVTDAISSVSGQLSSEAQIAIQDNIKSSSLLDNLSAGGSAIKLVASLIPGWYSVASELWTKDGTHYIFDSYGRIIKIIDKSGLNTYIFHYEGLVLHDVTDDLGRQVLFQFNTDANGNQIASNLLSAFSKPVVTRIWSSGFTKHNAILPVSSNSTQIVSLNYNWSSNGLLGTFFNFLPTLSSTSDPLGRIYKYKYDQESIITGGGSIKINFLALLLDIIPGAGAAVSNFLGISALTLSGNIEINLPYTISEIVAPGIGTVEISMQSQDLSQFSFTPTDYFLGLFPTALQVSYQIVFRLTTRDVTVISSTGVRRKTSYSYDWSSSDDFQFYVSQSTVDDGRLKLIHKYSYYEVTRNRFISWDDYLLSVAQELFQPTGLTTQELFTLEKSSQSYADSNSELIETVTNKWDTSSHRITSSSTTRGSSTIKSIQYSYDDWGNQTYVLTDTNSNGFEEKSEEWNWYLNTGTSTPGSAINWNYSSIGTSDNLNDSDVKDLLAGSLTRIYRLQTASGGYEDIAKSIVYNAYGLVKTEGLWNVDHWAVTNYTYYTDTAQLYAGAKASQTGPAKNESINWTYDYTSNSGNFYTETKTTQNLVDPTGTAVANIVEATAYDWNTGLKLYDKDGLGNVSEYAYDKLNRLTDTIKPGDETSLKPGDWSVVHTNAPWEHIAYDDTALTASVYREPVTSGVSTSLGNILERYTYDSLGQLIAIEKFNYHQLSSGQLVASSGTEDSKTTASYDPWGEVAAMTDPNGNTTSYTYDFMGELLSKTNADGTTVSSVFDYSENLKITTDERKVQTKEWFDWNNKTLIKIADATSMMLLTQYFYDASGQLIELIDPMNQITTTYFNSFGKTSELDHPSLDAASNPAIGSGMVNLSTSSLVPQELMVYDDEGQLIKQQVGSNGNYRETDYSYDTAGRQIKKIIGDRQEWNWYDAAGNLVKQADPYAVTQINAKTLDPTDIQGLVTKTYSTRHQLLTETDQNEATVRYTYDYLDRKIQMKDPRSNISSSITDAFTLNYVYNDLNRLVKADLPPVSSGTRGTVQFIYDLRGNVIEQIDQSGRISSTTYDTRNRKTSQSIAGADGSGELVTAWGYDAIGNNTAEIVVSSLNTSDPSKSSGLVTTKTYDNLNRLIQTSFPNGEQKNVVYDFLGRETQNSDAADNITYTQYNSLNKPIKVIDPENGTTEIVYDVWADAIQTTSSNSDQGSGNQIWQRDYDQYGKVIAERNNAGQSWSYDYDPRGLVISSVDPKGITTSNTYSATSRILQKALSSGSASLTQTWTYDVAGALMQATDGSVVTKINQGSGVFVADPYDLVNSYSTTVGSKTLTGGYTYDQAHKLTQVTYPDGQNVSYQYNGLEQLTTIPGFASNGKYNFMGRLTSLTAANGTQRTKSWNTQTGTLDGYNWNVSGESARALRWDNLGNLVEIDKNSQSNLYSYDDLNRITQAIEVGKFDVVTDSSMQAGTVKKDVGGKQSLEFVNQGKNVLLDYYSTSIGVDLGRVTEITKLRLIGKSSRITPKTVEIYISQGLSDGSQGNWTKLTDTTLVRDETGQNVQFASNHQARYVKLHMTWDERDSNNQPVDNHSLSGSISQLLQVYYIADGKTTTWTYDSLGNRMSENDTYTGAATTSNNYSYYPNSSLIQTSGSWEFNYDLNGNLISRGTSGTWNTQTSQYTWDSSNGEVWTYTYDLKNRLIGVLHGLAGTDSLSTIANYTYDIRDFRVMTVKLNETSYTQYDIDGNILWNDNGWTARKYIVALGQSWAEVDLPKGGTAQTYYHHTDHEGTTNVITDSNGNVVWNASYEVFGSVATLNGSKGFHPLYTGKELDIDTGLYYYNARWYDPTLGRFLTEDPARSGINWLEYALDNPLRYTDPTGLHEDSIFPDAESAANHHNWTGGAGSGDLNDMAGLSKISKGAAEEEGLSSVRNFSGEASLRGSQNMSEVPKSTPGNSPIAKDFKTEAAQTKTNAVDEKPGILDSTAKTGLKSLNAQRKSAVRKAWKEEKSLVQETGEGTRPWTDSQKAELLKNGKVKDFKGHHINNVNDHPDLAGDSRNIEFLTQKEHLDAHEGNFNNETHGPLIDRTTP